MTGIHNYTSGRLNLRFLISFFFYIAEYIVWVSLIVEGSSVDKIQYCILEYLVKVLCTMFTKN